MTSNRGPRWLFLASCLVAALLLFLPPGHLATWSPGHASPAASRPVDFEGPPGLQPGQPPSYVRGVLGGPPWRVSSQIVAHRVVEQWHYGAPHHLRLTFDCPRGQTPSLLRSRRINTPEP